MRRTRRIATGLALLALGACGGAGGREADAPPWSALVSPTAAMTTAFGEVCLAAVMDGRPIADLAAARRLTAVSPRSTGSPAAVAAWWLASYSNVYVMALPGGGCSASVEAGDPADLNAAALALMQARAAFAPAPAERTNGADRTAWCTAEADRPVVVALLQKVEGRRDAFVANVFRASGPRPAFCPPTV